MPSSRPRRWDLAEIWTPAGRGAAPASPTSVCAADFAAPAALELTVAVANRPGCCFKVMGRGMHACPRCVDDPLARTDVPARFALADAVRVAHGSPECAELLQYGPRLWVINSECFLALRCVVRARALGDVGPTLALASLSCFVAVDENVTGSADGAHLEVPLAPLASKPGGFLRQLAFLRCMRFFDVYCDFAGRH